MGKLKGFLEYRRTTAPYRPVQERIKDYGDVATVLAPNVLTQQAARCMDCGVPFCHAMGCPLENLIPEWNDLFYHGMIEEAGARLALTNNFPEITGRVCPAPCEAACTLSINDAPVTIRQIEQAIAEALFSKGLVVPLPSHIKTGKRIAIVGAGPAGLAAAQELARRGHEVVVFEKMHQPGGLLRYGIPNFKLEKWVIDRRLEQLRAEKVRFETDVTVGDDISASFLRRSFDALLITCGAEMPRDLTVPGRDLAGICYAMDFLSASNRAIQGEPHAGDGDLNAAGKSVLVIGGGDTGADCVGTAIRQGAQRVIQIEIMPKPQEWHNPWNPDWPYWPRILRSSSSHEEGCLREWSVLTKGFEGNGGRVARVHAARVAWDEPEGRSYREIPGSDFTIDADFVILALGFTGIMQGRLINDLGLRLTAHATIAVDSNFQTSTPGVFAAGDAVLGPSLVVRAIHQGREAARHIHSTVLHTLP
ncbi:MAG: glutamate synthase subunit beta [Desulfobacterota bacterium]|nr:glutamate synthase subunit beta [Thermodesulfobacteriota bacterium]